MRTLLFVAIFLLAGCVSNTWSVSWTHDDPERLFDPDAYDCEEHAVKRGASVLLTRDLQDSTQFVECMVRKYGWTRIARPKMK